jgi:hypothetical protein
VIVRRWRLIVQAALVGALAVLAFPADSSALRAVFLTLTPTGPAPIVLTIPAGLYPAWINQDEVTHAVVFANGLCSLQVSPGETRSCSNGFSEVVGRYPYTVDGTVEASIVVVPEPRAVTLTARAHRIQRGTLLTLHGQVTVPVLSPPTPPSPQPVTVLARLDSRHPFRRIAVVVARPHGWKLLWQLRVRPRATTTYIAEANSQPTGGQFWQHARSRPFKVLVTR